MSSKIILKPTQIIHFFPNPTINQKVFSKINSNLEKPEPTKPTY
jgi:hypothetical protein